MKGKAKIPYTLHRVHSDILVFFLYCFYYSWFSYINRQFIVFSAHMDFTMFGDICQQDAQAEGDGE